MELETKRIGIFGCDYDELQLMLGKSGFQPWRAAQIFNAIYCNLIESFDMINTLPAEIVEWLNNKFHFNTIQQQIKMNSKDGETHKFLFRLADGELIESVSMLYEDDGHRKYRRTSCISSQAGCALGCTFCATGQQGFRRNLTTAEIVEQVWYLQCDTARDNKESFLEKQKSQKTGITNVVFMGMGEPFHNYDNGLKAAKILNDARAFGIGSSKITFSTVGLVPGIIRFTKEKVSFNLAISLHAPDNETRQETVPINKKYPIEKLLLACREYIAKTNKKIFFEYVMLNGQNDTEKHAAKLGSLLNGLLCHVNLIPVNNTPNKPYKRSNKVVYKKFQEILQNFNVASTIRMEKGIDIQAGCGQLRNVELNRLQSLRQ